jgi:hypothetical protein
MLGQGYFLSLPERAIRSTAALVGGTSLLLTETLLPEVLRKATTYQITIGDLQKFLITRIGEVEIEGQEAGLRMTDAYLRKKIVGSSLEAIGLLTIRFSPVWIFAIIGDAAGGSKVFFNRLVQNLKDNEVIDQASDPLNLTDLLEAVQIASHQSARAIDTPPLSSDELATVTDELVTSYGRLLSTGQPLLLDRFDTILKRLDQVAADKGVSVEKVGGIMTLQAASISKASLGAGAALGKTSSDLFGEQILESYVQTLDEINRSGLNNYLSDNLLPYFQAAVGHLDPEKSTWTESFLALDNKNR